MRYIRPTRTMRRPKYDSVYFGNGQFQSVHRIIAEVALGRPLQGSECVHHADGDSRNNNRSNLVICPDNAYHMLLHKRMRDLQEKRKCSTYSYDSQVRDCYDGDNS